MIIAFIGDEKCCMANMIAFALTLYCESGKSILLADTGFGRTCLDEAFNDEDNMFVKEEAYYGIREGMDYLLYRMDSGHFDEKSVKEGVTYVTSDFAYVKCAIKGTCDKYEKNLLTHFESMSKKLLEVFDVVIVRCKNTADNFTNDIIKCCNVCIACFTYEMVMRDRTLIYNVCSNNCTYVMVTDVAGDCRREKNKIANACRVDERKFGLVPYNPYFDVRLKKGGLIKLFSSKNLKKASFDEFYRQMQNVLYSFRKWLEDLIYYE